MIAFLTDWGSNSYYVGVTKVVMREINRMVEIIDICHDIRPYSIRHGAYVLQRAIKDLPADAVFLAVVDPGVGTSRKPIMMVLKDGRRLVGPDNGLFTLAAEEYGIHEIRELENREYHRGNSRSFHGRDIFAPVAAHVDAGVEPAKLGSRLMSFEYLKYKKPAREGNVLSGEVAFYDNFGNLETNVPEALANDFEEGEILEIGKGRKPFKATFGNTYYDVNPGNLLAHFDSSGFLEITVNKGSARELLAIEEGEPITIVKT
ncbi:MULTISPECIES: SAM-dependent chlorinase/fluorinase [Mesotoga]|jgi:hypothetical protein|uniref:Adenosyl-chloride synthase n=1 Tax=Mesotoga prima MesG1.Ag.4.2 TaxID=660470 RepID=I2F2H6_9BACT|nr:MULTISPECIES: SAM-dependent chlorinase/fluorinase [Mesotoga]MCP5456401.1 SAM-dependent chlorinase/fluorinase [Thermotogota bacterium]AFK06129.1 hypothetical protein Theba_0401 [Mesotoga prima MesG1.Ag.4.2]MCP5460875.1 SAM-dependent chlorinase/fluorinase [Thermotogota bacterium]PIJ61939.1 hypothetical protein V513_04805 [Mesotoga sp. H07.pep.5.3]RLL88281.1 hypothetical protein Y696_13540 [Mesotoga sp. H07pep.5.4]